MKSSIIRSAVIAVFGSIALCAQAADIGTAGPFRVVGGGVCPKPGMDMLSGECDPAPIDAALPADIQSRARTDRALVLIGLFRGEQALEELARAIALNPHNASARHLRARYLLSNGVNAAMAVSDMREAIAISPDDPDFHTTFAAALRLKRDLSGAMVEVDASLARKPDNPDALMIKGDLLILGRAIEKAAMVLDRACDLAPDFQLAAIRDAEVHMRLDEPAKAEAPLSALLARSPNLIAYTMRANARLASGNAAGALEDFDTALGPPGGPYNLVPAGPTFIDLALKRAMLLHRSGRGEEAMTDIRAALDGGGITAVLRMQLFLRRNGYPEVPLDGLRSDRLDQSLRTCFSSEDCGKSVVRGI